MTMNADPEELEELVVADDPTDHTPAHLLDDPAAEDDDSGHSPRQFDEDTGTLHPDARGALVALLKERFIAAETHKIEWKGLTAHHADVRSRLNDMYLDLVYDAKYEVAYKVQVRNVDSTRTFPYLLRSMSWNREQTIVLVHLCITHRNQTVAGAARAVVSTSDIHAFAASVRPPTATDHHMDAGRVTRAIDAIRSAGLLQKTSEESVFVVAPVIERLMTLDKLRDLLTYLNSEEASDD
jgi:hypothetical protein